MHSFGLSLCCCPIGDAAGGAGGAIPPGYTSPTRTPEPGQAPTMRYRVIDGGADGRPRSWAIIMLAGDEIMSGLSDWMKAENVRGAHLHAIGALSSATFGWFDLNHKAYKNIDIGQQVECVGLIGDVGVTEKNEPALHVHGAVALPDGLVKGGHLLHAVAFPTLEVFATESAFELKKTKDPQSSLELFVSDLATSGLEP